MTKDKSKVLRETEQNPFEADEDKEEQAPPVPTSQSSRSATPKVSTPVSPTVTKKSKKDKKKKSKPFNLEAEKETMKTCIADSSVDSTNLLNTLRRINREQERISENKEAVRHFEAWWVHSLFQS